MDTIGLLAAWVGIISFLFAAVLAVAFCLAVPPMQRWWATTSKARAERRIHSLLVGLEMNGVPGNAHIADLISLYGSTILNLLAAVALVVISIEILDLAPAVLASVLPFNIDAKILTRVPGLLLIIMSYFFIFRLAGLAVKIRSITLPRKAGYVRMARIEIARLCALNNLPAEYMPDHSGATAMPKYDAERC
jgi:hypothetical protein